MHTTECENVHELEMNLNSIQKGVYEVNILVNGCWQMLALSIAISSPVSKTKMSTPAPLFPGEYCLFSGRSC